MATKTGSSPKHSLLATSRAEETGNWGARTKQSILIPLIFLPSVKFGFFRMDKPAGNAERLSSDPG
jgi:hypothetical protein